MTYLIKSEQVLSRASWQLESQGSHCVRVGSHHPLSSGKARQRFVWLLVLGAVLLLLSQAHAAETKALSMTVSFQNEPMGKYSILISLKNNGPHTLSVRNGQLPWGSPGSMIVIAVNQDGKVLPQSSYIQDPLPFTEEIKPGKSLSGKFYLNMPYPDISEQLKKGDMSIFWSYQMELDGGGLLERAGGWLLIPKTKPSTN